MTVQFTDPLFSDADGYDRDGYDANGYDRGGYDKDGANENGYDRNGSPRNVLARDLDLNGLWNTQRVRYHVSNHIRQCRFRAYLRGITREPEMISDVVFCAGDCGEPVWREDTSAARGDSGTRVCEDCASAWANCNECEELFPDGDLYTAIGGSDVCEGCRESFYRYCEDCDSYYHNDDSGEHGHRRGAGCCTSPQLEFAVRNDGEAPLPNDTRVTVTLPAGIITQEGLNDIRQYLRRQKMPGSGPFTRWPSMEDLSCDLYLLGDEWQTREGNYAKRLSRHAYQTYKLKLSPEIMSQVGVIAREHSNPVNVNIEVTRDLNESAAYFYHSDSCWWGSRYGESRCALKTNGGFAMRSFNDYGSLAGRAWVMPLRKQPREVSADTCRLVPTFNTQTPDAFVVFNGYGELEGYASARVMSHMAGWTYRKTGFECAPMFINAGGYLVGPEDIIKEYAGLSARSLFLTVMTHSNRFETEQADRQAEQALALQLAARTWAADQLAVAHPGTVAEHKGYIPRYYGARS